MTSLVYTSDEELSTDDEWDLCETPELVPTNWTSNNKELDWNEKYATQYINFTDSNPTTYHTIKTFAQLLETNSFTYIPENKPLDEETLLKFSKGGLFYTTRGGLTLVAFAIGSQWNPENGIGVVGAHVDALTVKLKPISLKSNVDGYNLLGVAPYSGALNKLWLDRDLGIGGRVVVRNEDGTISTKLIKLDYPIAKIPSIAEHFVDFDKQLYNKETQMVPIIGYADETANDLPTEGEISGPLVNSHSIHLLRYISRISETPILRLLGLDLELYDVQAASRGGISNEFIFAPRVDDRLCAFTSIEALIKIGLATSFQNSEDLSMVVLCDNEEIGSATRTGVKGKFLNATVIRILEAKKRVQEKEIKSPYIQSEKVAQILQREYSLSEVFANTVILSADVTHALNPNFKSAYLPNHYPLPNTGLTIKRDANMHVMTDSIGVAFLEAIAKKNGLKLQSFHIRNGTPSGGTIGPMISCDTGARTIDVGIPQLSMHSIRAMFGYKDVRIGVDTFYAFFQDYSLYRQFNI